MFAVLNGLADPIRLSIVAKLAQENDLQCGTFDVPVTKSTLSHHFRVLRESGVIATTKSGTRSLNRLRRVELDEAFPGLLDVVLAGAAGTLTEIARGPESRGRLMAARQTNRPSSPSR